MCESSVLNLIISIEQGKYDEQIEQILTAAHNRKYFLRRGKSRRG